MKKICFILVLIFLILTGCSSSPVSIAAFSEDNLLTPQEFQALYSSADDYKDKSVDFYGEVFAIETTSDGQLGLQVMSDIENYDKNTLVYFANQLDVIENDLVHIQGVISGTFEGENAMGGSVTAPVIIATNIEKATYIDAVSPTLKVIEVGESQTQHKITVELQKVEIAEKETRAYFKVTNDSSDNASFYTFNSVLIQGKKQLDEEQNYDAEYPEIQSDISPGIETEGMITYGPITQDENFKITCEANSDDYSKNFKLFTFNIDVK